VVYIINAKTCQELRNSYTLSEVELQAKDLSVQGRYHNLCPLSEISFEYATQG
jgi:hypothetical protein